METNVGFSLFGTINGFESKTFGLLTVINNIDDILDIAPNYVPDDINKELYAVHKINLKPDKSITLFCLYSYALRQSGSFRQGEHIGCCIGILGRVSKPVISTIFQSLIELMNQGKKNCNSDGRFHKQFNIDNFSAINIAEKLKTICPESHLYRSLIERKKNSASLIVLDDCPVGIPDIFYKIQEESCCEVSTKVYIGRKSDLTNKILHLDKCKIEYATQGDEIIGYRNKIKKLSSDLVDKESINSKLRQVDQESKELISSIQRELDSLKNIVPLLEEDIKTFKRTISEKDNDIIDLDIKIKNKKREIKYLKNDMKSIIKENRNIQRKLQSINNPNKKFLKKRLPIKHIESNEDRDKNKISLAEVFLLVLISVVGLVLLWAFLLSPYSKNSPIISFSSNDPVNQDKNNLKEEQLKKQEIKKMKEKQAAKEKKQMLASQKNDTEMKSIINSSSSRKEVKEACSYYYRNRKITTTIMLNNCLKFYDNCAYFHINDSIFPECISKCGKFPEEQAKECIEKKHNDNPN